MPDWSIVLAEKPQEKWNHAETVVQVQIHLRAQCCISGTLLLPQVQQCGTGCCCPAEFVPLGSDTFVVLFHF